LEVPRTADAVVIGGGCMGVSTAYHLSKAGLRVALVEQADLGSGTSGRSSAIVRTHYTLPSLVVMAQAALEDFRDWASRFPGDPGFRNVGFVVLVSEANVANLEANIAMQRRLGVDTEAVDAATALRLVPGMAVDDVGAAAYEPRSGYADPWQVISSLARGARDRGASVATGTRVTAIRQGAGGRVIGVDTDAGPIDAAVVVNAAGNWSGALSRPLGVELPVEPQRESIVLFDLPPGMGDPPIVIDLVALMYVRPHGGGRILFGDEDHTLDALHPRLSDPDTPDLAMPPLEAIENAADKAIRRFPALAEGDLVPAGYTGRYEVTPDFQPLMGAPAHVPGYYYAAGFSGHGFKLTPVIGRLMAEWVVDGRPSIDLAEFSAERFAAGHPLVAANPYRSGVGLV
jgi:sarcosine oxidase, subunit beta